MVAPVTVSNWHTCIIWTDSYDHRRGLQPRPRVLEGDTCYWGPVVFSAISANPVLRNCLRTKEKEINWQTYLLKTYCGGTQRAAAPCLCLKSYWRFYGERIAKGVDFLPLQKWAWCLPGDNHTSRERTKWTQFLNKEKRSMIFHSEMDCLISP